MGITIREEGPDDQLAIREVNRLAFGQDDEGRLVDALRDQAYARISLLAEDAGRLIGHILFSDLPILTPNGPIAALALAPLAVVPDRQRQGIGSMLAEEGLRVARQREHRIVLVLGHPEFYARFGFSSKLAERLRSPYSGAAFMALELVPRALEDVTSEVRYPPPFEGL
ncbi:MAG TPA: N-acetyltransferase [Isosphaeraceae bacterium]|nr:N-acetyltransferase [Isosphaeraceae bacterium]